MKSICRTTSWPCTEHCSGCSLSLIHFHWNQQKKRRNQKRVRRQRFSFPEKRSNIPPFLQPPLLSLCQQESHGTSSEQKTNRQKWKLCWSLFGVSAASRQSDVAGNICMSWRQSCSVIHLGNIYFWLDIYTVAWSGISPAWLQHWVIYFELWGNFLRCLHLLCISPSNYTADHC